MKKVFKLYLMLFLSITGTVFTTNAETKKILVVGNSFSNFTRIILPQISRYTITTKLKMEK